MGSKSNNFSKCTFCIVAYISIIGLETCQGVNLGLFAGDNKKMTRPITINKFSRHSPIFISIGSSLPKVTIKPKPLKAPIKPAPKPKTLRKRSPILPPLLPKLPLLPLVSRLGLIPKPIIVPPIIPPLPLLPLIPHIPPPLSVLPPLIPVIPKIPLLPVIPKLSRIPKIPRLGDPLKPLRIPILKKTPLEKALGTNFKTVTIPSLKLESDKNILKNLLDLRRKGSLTTKEYYRFRKILLGL